jgi:hypothetical protein
VEGLKQGDDERDYHRLGRRLGRGKQTKQRWMGRWRKYIMPRDPGDGSLSASNPTRELVSLSDCHWEGKPRKTKQEVVKQDGNAEAETLNKRGWGRKA